jgi:acetyl-CoA acetyltransferase
VQRLIDGVVATFGRVDMVINNAGLGGTRSLLEMTDEEWTGVLDVTLNGTFRCTRAAMRQTVAQGGGGVIVNNSSVIGWRAQQGQAHYAAAKAGVMALTRCAALDAAEHGIRTNAVAPNLPCIRTWRSAVLVASADAVRRFGVTPGARVHHISVRGDDPVYMLTAPIRATRYALHRAGMILDDIDLVEINEAFASVVLAWATDLRADLDTVNVDGGAIALGQPIGASGTKLMATLLGELERTGGRYGLQTVCESGGQANVTILERL